jgi:hypothetical protein
MKISYAEKIKPLFRAFDVDQMRIFGGFDLHNYEDVKSKHNEILIRVEDGSMPCDAPWSQDKIDLYKKWVADGMAP